MIKRILVGLSGTKFTAAAIRQAVELATAYNAEVTGVSVVDVGRLSHVGPVPLGAIALGGQLRNTRLQVAREHVQQSLRDFEQACGERGVRHRVLQEEGEPFSLMIDEARYHDLMIFGLRSLFEFDLVSDPHDALARLVASGVRPILAVSEEPRPIERVLIAYSGSMESAKTMKWFVQSGLWPQAKLRIVTFEHPPERAESSVADAVEFCCAHGFDPEAAYVQQSPKDHLLPYAAGWDADLIVVGNSAKNLLLRRLFGETALHVIRHADRPLFLAQ